jgi:hypothetical protein
VNQQSEADMSDEIRAAAERLRRIKNGEHAFDVYAPELDRRSSFVFNLVMDGAKCDRARLADAYLAANPSDGDEELTKDWLKTAMTNRLQHAYWPTMYLNQNVNMEAQDGICVVYCGGEVVCEVETRKDFRNLLAALGVA